MAYQVVHDIKWTCHDTKLSFIDYLVFLAAFNIFNSYHGVFMVSYQYCWSIYPATSQSGVTLTQKTLSAKEGSHYYHF